MIDLSFILGSMTSVVIIVIFLCAYYYINKHMFKKIVDEAIKKLDEKAKIINRLRTINR